MSMVNFLALFIALCISNLAPGAMDKDITIDIIREGDFPISTMLLKSENQGRQITLCVYDQKGTVSRGLVFERTGTDTLRFQVSIPGEGSAGSKEMLDLAGLIKSTSSSNPQPFLTVKKIVLNDGNTFSISTSGDIQYVRCSLFEGTLFVIHR